MKLQILVPQYQETEEIIRPLLDSIRLQQEVDLNEVGVIICNDGSEVLLSDEFLDSYPFKIEYHKCEHRGVSATRNSCMDHATADYVMFCDADDMFYNMCGLWILFREMETGFDGLVSVFIEDTRMTEDKKPIFINREMDSTFVHGKVWNLKYLRSHKLRFNDNLTIHEDSFFNTLAQNCSDNVKYCPTPFYLWCWRDESICRHDPKYLLKTYNNMLDSNEAVVKEFMERGMKDKALVFVGSMIFDAYYTMNKPDWINQDNLEYRTNTEKYFGSYFKKHKKYWDEIPDNDKMIISNSVRSRSVMEGMKMENVTIDQWLNMVEKLNDE